MGGGHLQEVPEHFVEPDLQVGYPCPFALAGLVSRYPFLATPCQIPQSVQLDVEPITDDAAVGDQQRRIVDQRRGNPFQHIGTQVQSFLEFPQQARIAFGKQLLQLRQPRQRSGETSQVPR